MPGVSSTAVESTAIQAMEYNPASRQLRVTFPGGNAYKYYDVPRSVYEGFLDAKSKGLYFNRYIRDRYDFALAA
jgi:KTSC domain